MQASTFTPFMKVYHYSLQQYPRMCISLPESRLLNTKRLEGWRHLLLTMWPWAGSSGCHTVECNGVSVENIQI